MRRIDYKDYLNRVYGCWLGKCVAGTIGAPYEGAKELFDIKFAPSMIESMLPNDDLDLQVLWLSVLEEKGINFTSDDLADAFLNRCRYAPGEYAYFKKNYARGIHPPMSGAYNNRYYIEGMGCPIRSEIWACVSPGNPRLAADLAAKDGILDHAGNSVLAEQFLAGLEAAAFFERDLDKLLDIGLELIPSDSKVAGLIRDVRGWCKSASDWRYVRGRIIRDYGHPDCTNMYQNIGITLLALYFGGMEFIDTTIIALNCGFDTDCTCATAGSILGIIRGADYLIGKHGLGDQGFILGVNAPRRSDRVLDLAEDTCLMGLHFAEHLNKDVIITNAPRPPEITLTPPPAVRISVDYQGIPAIGIGDTKTIKVLFEADMPISGRATISIPEGWQIDSASADLDVLPGQVTPWELRITVPADIEVLRETNLFEVQFAGQSYRFGLVGASVWQVFGPFWQNSVSVPPLNAGESYYAYIGGSDKDQKADFGRLYHLNTRVDLEKEYMTLDELTGLPTVGNAAKEARTVNFYEDLMSVNDAVGFQGPCAIYMVRRMISPEERKVGVLVGHTDAYRLWINGRLISKRDNVDWWTAENAHIHDVPILQGENTIIVELIRRTAEAKFSILFVKHGSCSEHFTDFSSVNLAQGA